MPNGCSVLEPAHYYGLHTIMLCLITGSGCSSAVWAVFHQQLIKQDMQKGDFLFLWLFWCFQAGTFEERDVTEWAKQQLQAALASTISSTASVTNVNSITGHANIWFIRGKKRHGFDFNIELAWQAVDSSGVSAAAAKGTLMLSDVTPDDLDDLHIEVKLNTAAGDAMADAAAVQAAKGLKQPLEQVIARFYRDLKTM